MDVICVDFETRSKADLKAVGGRIYAEHPSTECLCAVLAWPCGHVVQWWPGQPQDWIPALVGLPVVAHNGTNFDRHIWRRLGWPEPPAWYDTAQLARVAGYPRASLDWLGTELLGAAKDLEGSKLTKSLSACWPEDRARRKAGVSFREPHPLAGQYKVDPVPADTLGRVVTYCASDVDLLSRLWPLLEPFAAFDAETRAVDLAINDRGFCFDRDLARAVIAASEYMAGQAREEAGIDASVVRSPAKFLAALAELGVVAPNAQSTTLDEILDGGCSEEAAALIEARLGTATIAAGKLKAGLARCSGDGRLRDTVVYHQAHTGRWAGVGLQPHNLPK